MAQVTCQEKVKELEELLEEIINNGQIVGQIIAGPYQRRYRVQTTEGERLLLQNPNVKETFKVGKNVICNKSLVVSYLPELLERQETPVEFKPIMWEEIGGFKSQIEAVRQAVEFPLKYAKVYKEFGIRPSKGLLLYGPPGCGKTLIAKAIATTVLEGSNITNDSFVYMKGGQMLSPYVGVAENTIKDMFSKAREHYRNHNQRVVIFIDEAEAILPIRGSRESSDVDKTIVPTFLAEMDGFEENGPFIILATNLPDTIDKAVLRPGRIDTKIQISRPTVEDSCDIFRVHLEKTKVAGKVNDIAQHAGQFLSTRAMRTVSGALIENLVNESVVLAIKRRITDPKAEVGVTEEDLKLVISNLKA